MYSILNNSTLSVKTSVINYFKDPNFDEKLTNKYTLNPFSISDKTLISVILVKSLFEPLTTQTTFLPLI